MVETRSACVDGLCAPLDPSVSPCPADPPRCEGDLRTTPTATCTGAGRCGVEERHQRCAADRVCTPQGCVAAPAALDAVPFKGLQPDVDDPRPADPAARASRVAGNGAGRVAINLSWSGFQPQDRGAPCPARGEAGCPARWFEYDGRCFCPSGLSAARRELMRRVWAEGVRITGILFFAPQWTQHGCPADRFCPPEDLDTFARYAGFVAWYFRGPDSPGGAQVDDFVVWNEVNLLKYFDLRGSGAHDKPERVRRQATLYWRASDAIRRHRPTARVYVSLANEFGGEHDLHLDGYDVLDRVAATANGRPWHVAIHPYSLGGFEPDFSTDDVPHITFGTLGRLTGWLDKQHGWGHDVLISEVGFVGDGPDGEDGQRRGLCRGNREALATPGVTGFIYHRYLDIAAEGVRLGLHDAQGRARSAWSRWAQMDDPDDLRCGHEWGDHLELRRFRRDDGFYWVTTRRALPAAYVAESTVWRIKRTPGGNTHPLYDCKRRGGDDHFLSNRADCEGHVSWGRVGYAWNEAGGGRRPIWRCIHCDPQDRHMASPDRDCERAGTWCREGDSPLGWGL